MIFFVGFVEETEESLFMVIVFQNIVYVGLDLSEKMVVRMFKCLSDLKINLIG
jgi:hypothetical protein